MFQPTALKAPVQPPPRHVSACAPASPATEREILKIESYDMNVLLHVLVECAVTTFLYLLGAGASTEKLFTVFPAALERRLDVGTGVVTDQVLLQVLHRPEHQRAAVPLSMQDTDTDFTWRNLPVTRESRCERT